MTALKDSEGSLDVRGATRHGDSTSSLEGANGNGIESGSDIELTHVVQDKGVAMEDL